MTGRHTPLPLRTVQSPSVKRKMWPASYRSRITPCVHPNFIWKKKRKVSTTRGLVTIPSLYQICRHLLMLVNSRYCNLYFKRLLRNKFSLPNGSLSMVCIQANKTVLKATLHSHLPSLGHHLPRARCLAYWTLCAVILPRAHLKLPFP